MSEAIILRRGKGRIVEGGKLAVIGRSKITDNRLEDVEFKTFGKQRKGGGRR
jgi:hypothetical protein